MSVLPQVDPDETIRRTNPSLEEDLFQDVSAAGRALQTDPEQQAASARPITRPDPSQATIRPVRMRQLADNVEGGSEPSVPARQFKSFQMQLNMKTTKIPAESSWPSQQKTEQLRHGPDRPPTPVQPYNRVSNEPVAPAQPDDRHAQQHPGAPMTRQSHDSEPEQTLLMRREVLQTYNMPGADQQMQEPLRTPTGSYAVLPRRRSGFLGIDEMPTTRLEAIKIQAKELATIVAQPQVVADIIVQGEAKKPSKKNWMGFALRAGITLLIFFFLLKGMDWGHLIAVTMQARKTFLLIGFFAGILCVFFSAWGWRAAVAAENINADLSRLIALYLVGLGFSHFLPTSMGGDAVKAYYVGRDSGNMAGAASSALTSRITSFIGMLIVAVPGVILFQQFVTRQVTIYFGLLSLLLLGGIASALLIATYLPKLTRLLPAKIAKNKIIGKVLEVGTAMTKAAKKPRAMVPATLFGMLFWIASFINYYGYAVALGIKVPLPFYVIAIPFVSIVTALPISIGGFGVREGTFVWLFTQLPLNMHIAPSSALALALLMDAQVLFFGLIGGVIYFTMPKQDKIPPAQQKQ